MAELSDIEVIRLVMKQWRGRALRDARAAIKDDKLKDWEPSQFKWVVDCLPYAVLCSTEEQTRIAEKMHAESRTMKWLTVCVAVMTLVNVVLVGVQVWAALT